jgi:hypothetical protein
MKTFLVSLKIQAGEYEKSSSCLVSANTEALAVDYAIYLEAHDPDTLDWDDNGASDLGWEFYYTGSGTKEVPAEEAQILAKYFTLHECDRAQLTAAGNWLTTQEQD